MNKYRITDIGGSITKEDDRYKVCDNSVLNNLVLSSTDLKPKKSTSGHKHPGQEEIYFFIKGNGEMEINENKFPVTEGDTVLIKDGDFHRVHAGNIGCYFVCVFDGKRNH
jgi:quercetin dioxygenase-like cupin family protein